MTEVLDVLGMTLPVGKGIDLSSTAMICCPSGIGQNKSRLKSFHASLDVSCGCSGSHVVLFVNIVHVLQPATLASVFSAIFGNQKRF